MTTASDKHEAQQARAPAATYANRIYIEPAGDLVRIAFGETFPDGGPIFRLAVTMSPENALALRDLIDANIKRIHDPKSTVAN